MSAATDAPVLSFVDPAETDDTYRVCLWAAPGQGKSVAAASAPAPILVLSADRPSAYKFARKHHAHTKDSLREVRYVDISTLEAVYRYLDSDQGAEVKTLVIDPVSHVVDALADVAPQSREGGPDYQWINKKMLGFIKSLRRFDVNVVLVAHEKLNDGKKGDGRLYPAIGGPTLINKLLAEMDIVAHVERVAKPTEDDPAAAVWIGQIQPRDNIVCKDATGALGDKRIADLARWFEVASEALRADDDDLPWVEPAAEPEPDTEPADDANPELAELPLGDAA
ncbi:MAG TPA: AAA family ATPase [Baekduia sp.]|nr:AAA family ATPase [Baekduia sp.]